MSGGSKTTNQITNSSSNFNTTPIVPGFAQGPVENYMGQVGGLISKNWTDPNFLKTPTNGLLDTASSNAMGLPNGQAELGASNALAVTAGTSKAPTIAPVKDLTTGAGIGTTNATASSLLEGLDDYFNPYQQRVIDTTLANADLESAKQMNALRASQARSAAFGGSRDALAITDLAATQERQRAKIEADLQAAGFDKATAMSLADAQMRTQTSQFNAGQANQAAIAAANISAENERANKAAAEARALQEALFGNQALDRALSAAGLLTNNATAGSSIANNNVATQAGLGKTLWDIDSANNRSEVEGLEAIQGLLDPSLWSPFVGQNVSGTENSSMYGKEKKSGGLLGSLASIASIASVVPGISDRRAKTNIVRVGTLEDGLGVYDFDYVWGGPRQRGVMADEVAELRPWALGPVIGGFASVNYGAL